MSGENPLSIDALRQKRAAISEKRKREAANRALDHLGNTVHLTLSFAPIGSEIDLWPLNHRFAKNGILALPRVEGDHLACYRVDDLDTLIPSKWGILEPNPQCSPPVSLEEIDTILVPGLAFDERNERRGYGKGFYDRLLCHYTKGKAIGVGFKEQLVTTPLQTHEGDVPLDSLSLF